MPELQAEFLLPVDEPSTSGLTDIGNPVYIVLGLLGFSAVAHDVFSPDSMHLLAPLDHAGNSLTQFFDFPTRKYFWGKFVSNGFIWSASAAWIVATAAAVSRRSPKAWAATAAAWVAYLYGAGRAGTGAAAKGGIRDAPHAGMPACTWLCTVCVGGWAPPPPPPMVTSWPAVSTMQGFPAGSGERGGADQPWGVRILKHA